MAHIRNNCLKENSLQVEINQQCQDISNISGNDCCDEMIDGLDSIDNKIDSLSQKSEECCDLLTNKLNIIDDKLKPKTIIVEKPIIIKEYVEVRTTVYVPICKPKPPKTETLPPTNIPPSSIPGWLYDEKNGYYYKFKRGVKYIKINNNVWREDEYNRDFKTPYKKPSHHNWNFPKFS